MFSDNGIIQIFGYKHAHSIPSACLGYISEETHGVGAICGRMTLRLHISLSFCSMGFLSSVGTFLCACCTGGMLRFAIMWFLLGKLPVVSKKSGKTSIKSSKECWGSLGRLAVLCCYLHLSWPVQLISLCVW